MLVYHFFVKALGRVRCLLSKSGWFVMLPLWSEIKAWRLRWPHIRQQARLRRTMGIGLVLILVFVVPWPTRLSASGLLRGRPRCSVWRLRERKSRCPAVQER